MKKEQITRLLEHWRRLVPGSDLFKFSHVLVNSKSGEMAPALYTNSLGPRSLPQNDLPMVTNEPATGAATWDAEYRNSNLPAGDDSRFSVGPDINMSTEPADVEGREQASPEPDQVEFDLLPPAPVPKPRAEKSKGKPKQTAPAKKSVLVPTAGNGPLVSSHPRPKPKAMNPQATLVRHGSAAHQSVNGNCSPPSVDAASENITQTTLSPQPATMSNVADTIPLAAVDLQQGDQGEQIEGVLARSRRQPKKRKLDPCLVFQFEAFDKEMEREQAKLDKVRAERLMKRDAWAGQPSKRRCTQ